MKEKILLLCDIPPCKNYTGGIMISQLLNFLIEEKESVDCFCIMDECLQPEYDKVLNDINFTILKRPSEIVSENKLTSYYRSINKLEKKLVKFIEKNEITKIWCPVQGEVLTLLLNKIYEKKKIPYVVQIWDPIEWWIKEHNFSESRKDFVLEEHKKLIKNSEICITTSDSMSKHFNKEFKTKCIEVMPPLKRKVFENINKEEDKFIIAMSGQIYAVDELDAFLTALDKMEWKIGNKNVFFEHYGLWNPNYIDFNKHSKYKDRIVLKGFVEQNILLNKLSKSDLLYCPYFFSTDEVLKKVSCLSFPSKVVTYLALDVPILYHGPSYSGPYNFLKKNNCAILLSENDPVKIKKVLETIDKKDTKSILNNVEKTFEENFSYEKVKYNFLKSLGIKYDGIKKLKILEVNNVDLPGRRFNGYDLLDEINNNTVHSAKQIVTYKTSTHEKVYTFYDNDKLLSKEWALVGSEQDILSVHSQLSFTSNILKNKDIYKEADVVHYHLIHNTKLSLSQMIELCADKPSVLTLHDPWNFTGRCAYPQECEKWKTGCKNCDYLSNLFPFTEDNCNSLWNLKKKVYNKLDIDIIISTPFMKEMLDISPLTKHFKHVHILPFGIDLERFNVNKSKEESRRKFGIGNDEFVLFFRAQMAMKGTEYIIEALKMLETDKKITLLSCSEVGLLEELKDKYKVVDLGNIGDKKMVEAFNACDVFLMPSRGESFGLMAIEAMASSRPVVVFNNSALPYVTFAPECGVLVENKNSKKLMEAIKHLIDNPKECEKRGKLGRKLAEQHYDLKKYNEKIMDIYQNVYERQKNKKIKTKDTYEINRNSKDVQELLPKLEKIYRRVFGNKDFPGELSNLKDEFMYIEKDNKIDYSSWDVINLLELFNKHIYDELQNYSKFIKNSKFKKLHYYLKYDREAIYNRIDSKLNRIPIVYGCFRISYKIAKRIRNIIFCDHYKILKKENDALKYEINIIKEQLKGKNKK